MLSSSSCRYGLKIPVQSPRREGFPTLARVNSRLLTSSRYRRGRSTHLSLVRSQNEDNPAKKLKETKRAEVFWDGFDLLSVGGTVGGAVLVLLGYDIMFIALPIALPLTSLFVGIRRERHKTTMRDEFDSLLLEDLSKQRIAVERVGTELSSVSTEIETLVEGKMNSFENKLNQIEGTMITTSRNVQRTVYGLKTLPGILKRVSEMQQKTVIYAVTSEFRSLFERWGETQLQAMNQISQRLSYIEDSIGRLETYESIPGNSAYSLPEADTIDVAADKAEELKQTASSVLEDMRSVITTEISSVLGQLKDNQVDMMQSFRDVRMNAVPQADYSFLADQLEKIEHALQNLPDKISETFKSEEGEDYLKDSYSKQFTAVSSVLTNLEKAIEELKKATVKGQSAVEMESLENKWIELRSLMQSLGEKISGVNDRVEQIVTNPTILQENEIPDSQSTIKEEEEPINEGYLEFQESSEPLVPAPVEMSVEVPDEPSFFVEPEEEMKLVEEEVEEITEEAEEEEDEISSWEVVDSYENYVYPETSPESSEETDEIVPQTEVYEESGNGVVADLNEEIIPSEITEASPEFTTNGDVSPVGNVKRGLDLLKKGRRALEEDYGIAYKYLVRALEQFESILEVDPTNVRCLGNCGNTLLALGELKIVMAKDLKKSESEKNGDSSNSAVEQLEQEALDFLVLAGARFKSLLEIQEDDKRAFMNWGKALCMRARTSPDPAMKMQLYDAAIVKYEKVLSFAPEFVSAMFFCGVALKESSEVRIGSPMDMRNRISQAIVYFEDVERLAPSSPLQFEAFQMKQQCYQSAQSPTILY